MSDFISSFFSWGNPKENKIIERKRVIRKSKLKERIRLLEIEEPKVEKIKLPREEREEEDE
tara:strand:+ start:757 stop:939 length:183 start_codon:yes stop_codon:yes gene_type:complete